MFSKFIFITYLILSLGLAAYPVTDTIDESRSLPKLQLLSVQRIWDEAPHNAFTDLVHFNNRWFCAFREGSAHASPDGAIRIITSLNGITWETAALIKSPNSDLRDTKITITPDQQLMLTGAEALHDKSSKSHQSLAWFSNDGFKWSEKSVTQIFGSGESPGITKLRTVSATVAQRKNRPAYTIARTVNSSHLLSPIYSVKAIPTNHP